MCNKYYPAIISAIGRIVHEFYISFVIITWYVGTVIGSFMAIHLHTINRRKSELVLLVTGISFQLCILIETQLSIDSSHFYYFLLRIVLGTLIGVFYLTSVTERSSNCNGSTRSAHSRSTSICCCFTIATIISCSQTTISIELCCVSLTVIYSLIALNLSHSSWVFSNEVEHWRQWQRQQTFCTTNDTTDVSVRSSNVQTFSAFNLVVGKQTRPLIYLAGAKLLTVFCYFLPFICIASRFAIQANILFTDDDDNENGNDPIPANEDGVSNIGSKSSSTNDDNVNYNISNYKLFTDLVVLLLIRIALGSITILFVRHNVSYLSIIYLIPITMGLAILLLIPLFNPIEYPITVQTIAFSIIMVIYVAFSLIVDIIGHHATLYANETVEYSPNTIKTTTTAAVAAKVISLTFATFIEHLIDICMLVIYLNDWISTKLMATSFAIIFLTMIFSQKSKTNSNEKSQSSNLITVKYQIL